MINEAVILAAGEGIRLRPFTESIPKVMLPIVNKPILEYLIEALAQNGITKIIIVVGYKKESVMDYFESGKKFGVQIKYVTQDKQLGTGHALLQAKKYLSKQFLILPGDNIINSTLLQNLDQDPPVVVVTESEIPSKYGVVEIDKDAVRNITEKPSEKVGNLISTGIYVFQKKLLDEVEVCASEGIHDLTIAIQRMIKNGVTIQSVMSKGLWMDAVYPWDLLLLNETAVRNHPTKTAGTVEEGVKLKGTVFIGKKSIIRSGSYIVGPVVIGEGCEIGPQCCIFPSTAIGDNVSIGPFTTVRQSIVMDDVWIGSHCAISHTVVGRGCRFENNVMQLVGSPPVKINGDFITVDHVGGFVGDDTQVGSSTIIEAGKIIGKSCTIEAMKNIRSNVDSGSHVM